MKKDVLALGLALLVGSTVASVPVLSLAGTIATVYGLLAKEIEEED